MARTNKAHPVQMSDHQTPDQTDREPDQKPPIGRPPIAEEDQRSTLVRVLTTKAEHEELKRAASAASMSVSTWVRAAALEKARRGPGTV